MKCAKRSNTPGFRALRKALCDNPNDNTLEKIIEGVKNKGSTFTKFVTYRTELNPDLNVHAIYGKATYIPDYLRISFTRLRLMSHRLKIETGRWSHMSRDRRVCQCNNINIQDEKHALLECRLSTHLRADFGMLSFASMDSFLSSEDTYSLCKYVHKVLKIY